MGGLCPSKDDLMLAVVEQGTADIEESVVRLYDVGRLRAEEEEDQEDQEDQDEDDLDESEDDDGSDDPNQDQDGEETEKTGTGMMMMGKMTIGVSQLLYFQTA